ncbi:GntT/GntP/DsdX family permease, partial [Staphylococcus epidermidis]
MFPLPPILPNLLPHPAPPTPIPHTLIPNFPHKHLQSPIFIPPFILPIALFFQLRLLLLIPLLFTLAKPP